MTTIVVVGNVDPQKAQSVIAKYFGGLETASGPKPAVVAAGSPEQRRRQRGRAG